MSCLTSVRLDIVYMSFAFVRESHAHRSCFDGPEATDGLVKKRPTRIQSAGHRAAHAAHGSFLGDEKHPSSVTMTSIVSTQAYTSIAADTPIVNCGATCRSRPGRLHALAASHVSMSCRLRNRCIVELSLRQWAVSSQALVSCLIPDRILISGRLAPRSSAIDS